MNGHMSAEFLKIINECGTSNRMCFYSRVDTYSRDSIDNIMFSLHLALNTWREKDIQSYLTISDIEE